MVFEYIEFINLLQTRLILPQFPHIYYKYWNYFWWFAADHPGVEAANNYNNSIKETTTWMTHIIQPDQTLILISFRL